MGNGITIPTTDENDKEQQRIKKYKIQHLRQPEYREIVAVWKDSFCHNQQQNENETG